MPRSLHVRESFSDHMLVVGHCAAIELSELPNERKPMLFQLRFFLCLFIKSSYKYYINGMSIRVIAKYHLPLDGSECFLLNKFCFCVY